MVSNLKLKCLALFCMVILLFPYSSSIFSQTTETSITPMTITFEVILATRKRGRLNGTYDSVVIRIGNNNSKTGRFDETWDQVFEDVTFHNGLGAFVLGTDGTLTPDVFDIDNPLIQIETGGLTAQFPMPSVPYAIIANTAEYVEHIQAKDITGEFITTVNVQSDLHVYTSNDETVLFVDSVSKNVGIATSNPRYPLDVNGILNAKGYLINGEDIESFFSWASNGNSLYYNKGNVGIGTATPSAELHVVGTINAQGFLKGNQELTEYLKDFLYWTRSPDGSSNIYFLGDNGKRKVGIGVTTNMKEKLEINGGLVISDSIQTRSKVAGTIEYNSVQDKFIGYGKDGTGYSLNEIQTTGDLVVDGVVLWSADKKLTNSNKLVFKDNKLGIATANPEALLAIQGDGETSYIAFDDAQGNSVFYISPSGNIGIGKAAPQYALDVKGVVDATDFLINGSPIQFQKGDSFWSLGNSDETGTDLFYVNGNVGIGTNDPNSLLELASTKDDVRLTFDIAGDDLFTLGIDESAPERFIISEGSDLSDPVFVFEGDTIGVGTHYPKTNLHVSGNAGFLVEGEFDDTEVWSVTGNGTRLFFFPGRSVFRAGRVEGSQWDNENLGDYSVAFGFNNTASGDFSFIGGGDRNIASGNYASIPGGYNNRAFGDYSFAAGYEANALHDGSFVWADSTPTGNAFSSTAKNQFLIRAYGGVGINTTDTAGATMVVSRKAQGNILELQGLASADDSHSFVVNANGQVGVGTKMPGNAQLSVEGRVGIGTNDPKALLEVHNDGTDNYLLYVNATNHPNASSDSVVVITSTGNVGIGTTSPGGKLDVNGSIFATSFITVDPNDPSGQSFVTLQPFSGSPWSDPSKNPNGNTYRLEGFIGIGTATPNSLLELSNQNISGSLPVITFDMNEEDYYRMGVVTDNKNNVYFAIASSQNFTSDLATFVVTNNTVVIGGGVRTSNFTLDVSGNVSIDGKLFVGTANVDTVYDAFVDGAIAVTSLNISGKPFEEKDSPWRTSALNLYTTRNVGIFKSDSTRTQTAPNVALEVEGIVSVNTLLVGTENFLFRGDLYVDELNLMDQGVGATGFGRVSVENNKLKYVNPSGFSKILSSTIQIGDDQVSGPLAYWIDDATLGVLPVLWDEDENQLFITANFIVDNFLEKDTGLKVTTNLSFKDNGMLLRADLDHYGDQRVITDYTLQTLQLSILEDWGLQGTPVFIKGIDLSLSSDGQMQNNSQAIGLYIDVTSVNVNADSSKYAAIFKGGNVGIGVDQPSYALEVNGVISANYLTLPKISSSELVVDDANSLLVVKEEASLPRVGIGVKEPRVALDVNGTVSINSLIVSGGLESVSMNIGNGKFVIDEEGKIGVGVSDPLAYFDIYQELTSIPAVPYVSEKIELTIDGVERLGQKFYFAQDVTGLKLSMNTNSSSYIANQIKGLDINLSSVNVQSGSQIYGLYVDVEAKGAGQRYAAIFNGGNVGIGIENPEVALHVSGNIRANSLILDGGLVTTVITVNNLIVHEVASVNQLTVSDLMVLGVVTASVVNIEEGIEALDADFDELRANTASLNVLEASLINVTNSLSANEGQFLNSLSVGTTNIVSGGIFVDGEANIKQLNIRQSMSALTLNVGEGNFFVGANQFIGIGTTQPEAPFHMVSSAANQFNVEDNRSWNAMKLGLTENLPNQAVGFIFAPQDTPSRSIGSGIVAQAHSDLNGSDLLFITDPSNDFPVERMRISSEGLVGIGTQTPAALLDVNGDVKVSGDLTVLGDLNLTRLVSDSNLTLSSDSGRIDMLQHVSFQQGASVNWLALSPVDVSTVVHDNTHGFLYFDENDKDLYFYSPRGSEGVSINLTASFTGTKDRIPFINNSGSFSDAAFLYWDESLNRLTIGTSNVLSAFELNSTFDIASDTGSFSAEIISVNVKNRSGILPGLGSTFIGMDIAMKSTPLAVGGTYSDLINAGRLGDDETAIGLYVDMSDLLHRTTIGGMNFEGQKYAAIFNGGAVGIGLDTPEAMLHVKQDSELYLEDVFRVDADNGENLFVITNEGRIGIGNAQPDALFHINANTDQSDPIFVVTTANMEAPSFIVDANGNVGIGIESPSVPLEVRGAVSANLGLFNTVSVNRLEIGDNLFVLDETGAMSIGTDNTQLAGVFLYKELKDNTGADVISEKIEIVIDGQYAGGSYDFAYDKNITGFELEIDSADSNTLLGNATGVSINMSGLDMGETANAYGLYVDVGTGKGNRYAAILNGKVGIASQNPTHELVVNGTIHARDLILDGSLELSRLTADRLVVEESMDVSQHLEVKSLVANNITVNSIVVLDTVKVSTASFQVITVNNSLYSNGGIAIGRDLETYDLAVSGNGFIDGDVIVNGTLTMESINFSGPDDIVFNKDVLVQGDISVNKAVVDQLTFKGISSTMANNNSGQLFMSSLENKDLIYMFPGETITTVNLTSLYRGNPNRLAYYTTDGVGLASDMPVEWDKLNNTLRFGSSSDDAFIHVHSELDPNQDTNLVVQNINMSFKNRAFSTSSTRFKGLNIEFSSLDKDDPYDFGRLGSNETAIGLEVNLSNLASEYIDDESRRYKANKYAAIFRGGIVGIGTDTPEATLHIVSEKLSDWYPETGDIFRIDSDELSPAILVNSEGKMGLNVSAPSAQLEVIGVSGEDTVLAVYDSGGDPKLIAAGNGVAINTTNISTNGLIVEGEVLFANSESKPVLYIDPNSNGISIGTENNSAILDIEGSGGAEDYLKVKTSLGEPVFAVESNQKIGVGLADLEEHHFDFNVNGLVLAIDADVDSVSYPSDLVSEEAKGYLSVVDNELLFFGFVTENTSTLMFGDDPSSRFSISHFDGSKLQDVMVIQNNQLGVGKSNPSYALDVSGNMNVADADGNSILFVDSDSGNVGINKQDPGVALDIAGKLTVDSFEVTDSGILISTLNVLGTLELEDEIKLLNGNSGFHASHLISLNLTQDLANNLSGLRIQMESGRSDDDDPYKLMYDGADAIGLYVDMSDVVVASERTGPYGDQNFGHKYAAVFKGGAVGIGTQSPKYPLQVVGESNEIITGFGSVLSELVIRDYGEGAAGFNIVNNVLGQEHIGLVIKKSEGSSTGLVGIGTTNPDKSLVVNGDMRLGVVTTRTTNSKYGSKLFFSGGDNLSAQVDSDNNDDLWIARYNEDENVSRLRLNFSTVNDNADDENGVANGYDMFTVGYNDEDSYYPVLKVHNNHRVSIWGDKQNAINGINSVPDATLHVVGNSAGGDASQLSSYLTAIENTTGDPANNGYILGLVHSGTEPNSITEKANFITFMSGQTIYGEIEGNGSQGIRYKTKGADYAEYLEKKDLTEVLEVGDIVAVNNGKITKDTSTYQQLMVISGSAGVAGNWPGQDKGNFELVSFFGQVETKVRGRVMKGDFILPSGDGSGVGVAVSPELLTIQQRSMIVGRSWETSGDEGIKMVNVAVGFAFGENTLKDEYAQINVLSKKLETMETKRTELIKNYQEKLDAKNKKIDALLSRLETQD